MIHFHPTPRRTTRALISKIETAAMTPSLYLRLRRQAAGVTIRQAAQRMFSADASKVDLAVNVITALETPGVRARIDLTLERLQVAFSFDPDVYRQLANEPVARHPLVCLGCGCTQNDACVSVDGHTACGWHDSSRCGAAICTRCAGKAQ